MEQFLSDAKRLVHRLHSHDASVDVLISEATELQNKLIAMRHYRDEVGKMNDIANHRPRSTLILGSQLENQRIQTLESENRELSVLLAEHQAALDMIMNKYREQVMSMMKSNADSDVVSNVSQAGSVNEDKMKQQISEMAYVMKQSVLMDDQSAMKELSLFRQLQVENENLRELLSISGQTPPPLSNTTKLEEIYKNYNVNLESDLVSHTESKHSSLSGNKDSGIYENGEIHSPIDNKKFTVYDSLENLYQKSNDNDDENSSTQNCFRAIITDIKPLIETRDNEKIEFSDETDSFSGPSTRHDASEINNFIKYEFAKQEKQSSNNLDSVSSNSSGETLENTPLNNEIVDQEDNDSKEETERLDDMEFELENELNTLHELDSMLSEEYESNNSETETYNNHITNDVIKLSNEEKLNQETDSTFENHNIDLENVDPTINVVKDISINTKISSAELNDSLIGNNLVNGLTDDSDCESEKTVVNDSDNDINDVMACFDSVLSEQEMSF